MNRFKKFFKSFTVFEYCLWGVSSLAVVLSFLLCGNKSYLNLAGALVGVTSLIFLAKGNVAGNFLVIAFSVLYGVISYLSRYYGEMITYLCMTTPAAVVSVVTWLKNPFRGNRAQVKINRISKTEYALSFLLACGVTIAFYFILRALDTPNLVWSTVSVLTSFYASYLNIRRCPLFALAYACNDVVLIVLWALLSRGDSAYLCMVVCFSAFLINDLYGFYSWLKMRKKQSENANG